MAPDPLTLIWQRLAQVHSLHSQSRSQLQTGWNGQGEGRVPVESPSANTLIFNEDGHWQNDHGIRFPFRNIYRWTLHTQPTSCIALEHLRFGPEKPVFLIDLVPDGPHRLHAITPHLCGDDRYNATLALIDDTLHFEWIIKGPAKDEHLLYIYQ